MPLRVNYPLPALTKELEAIGIFLMESFPDGQIRWGTAPMPKTPHEKFTGRSVMTAPYIFFDHGKPRFDVFTVRNILERLGKTENQAELEKKLEPSIMESD